MSGFPSMLRGFAASFAPRHHGRQIPLRHLSHLDITSKEPRLQDEYVPATVVQVEKLSESVRLLRLRVKDKLTARGSNLSQHLLQDPKMAFSYKGGQWVDLDIPGVAVVGGFSFVSAPNLPPLLAEKLGLPCPPCFDLAIRNARHPPAAWVHGRDTGTYKGERVLVRVGGSFTLDRVLRAPASAPPVRHILLIAGGVGINPLFSMLIELAGRTAHWMEKNASAGSERSGMDHDAERPPSVTLLYTCRQEEDFLFLRHLKLLHNARDALGVDLNVHVHLTTTRGPTTRKQGSLWDPSVVHNGRITEQLLQSALVPHSVGEVLARGGGSNGVTAALCGPPAMTDALVAALKRSGLHDAQIHYEKWW